MSDGSHAVLTVRDALSLEGVQEWVVNVWPNGGLDRAVRWVHCPGRSSMDVGKAGDLVIASSAVQEVVRPQLLGGLVESSGRRGVVALGFCLDTSMLDESTHEMGRIHRMPLVALDAQAPSTALAERMNRAIAELETSELRSLDEVTRVLHETLAGGFGLHGLMKAAADLACAPVALLTPIGRIVSIEGYDLNQDFQEAMEGEGTLSADVEIQGRLWGTVVIGKVSPSAEVRRQALLLRLPGAIAIEVMRSAEWMPPEERARRELVIDLLVGAIRTESEFVLRAASSDFHLQAGHELVGLAMPLVQGIRSPAVRALRSLGIQSLEAELDTNLLLLLSLPDATDPFEIASQVVDSLPQRLVATEALSGPIIAVGPPVEPTDAGRSLQEARDTLSMARDAGTQLSVVTTQQFAVERLLAKLLDGPDLTRFSDELLRPLIRYDTRTNGQLVHTLETYFENRMSKTDTANALHLRRQSLYGRLDRIVELIGPLDDPDFCLALQIALKAHRLIISHGRRPSAETWWLPRLQAR